MWIIRLFLLFLLYSGLGWIYETTFCTLRDMKWENRGFLYGPVCPIYGAGAAAITLLSVYVPAVSQAPAWGIFLLSMGGSAVLEFVTSWVLEKLFHAVWWDYSRLPFNLQGRISLFTSCGFGLAGVVIVRLLSPLAETAVGGVPDLAAAVLALLLTALLSADLTLTVSALTDFAARVDRLDQALNQRMDTVVESAHQRSEDVRERVAAEGEQIRRRLEEMSASSKRAVRRARALRYPRMDRQRLETLLRELREILDKDIRL